MGFLDEVNAVLDSRAPQPDSNAAGSILQKYSHLNFVQRLLQPDKYPKINNPDGSYSTHLMSWGDNGNSYMVYPSIVQPRPGGPLVNLGDKAQEYAQRTGQFIPFKRAADADWFSQRYKVGMPTPPPNIPNWEPEQGAWGPDLPSGE